MNSVISQLTKTTFGYFSRVQNLIILIVTLTTLHVSADVNVLIIGSSKDTTDTGFVEGNSKAFSPTGIKTQLENILGGATDENGVSLGNVNVTLEDRYAFYNRPRTSGLHPSYFKHYSNNLISWFHYPYFTPTGGTTTSTGVTSARWSNLRGQAGTVWDYVVIIGDPYTIEKMPGLYTHGVAKIAEEVAKGPDPAEVILLMPWQATGSSSTVDHYKEVVYRTGRSGGFKVASAGLAWGEASEPRDGLTHPSADGAYIAAASIYSRIWNTSAETSAHSYTPTVYSSSANGNTKLGDIVHTAVNANKGAPQYTGKFNFQSPFKMFNIKSRFISPGRVGGGSSTENDLVLQSGGAINRVNATFGSGGGYLIGRDTFTYWDQATDRPHSGKDYRNGNGVGIRFGYFYHWEGNNAATTAGNIVSLEMELANDMISESDDFRLCPRRMLLAGIQQAYPNTNIVSGGHSYGPQATAQATYMYTIYSSRTPVDTKPADTADEEIKEEWYGQKEGYEMAWRVGMLQVRAPGFKVSPSSATIGKDVAELINIEFINQPKSDVTVTISSNSSDVTISPSTLTFSPGNHAVRQQFSIIAKPGAVVGSALNISFSTSSNDEVFDDLDDSWSYEINAAPTADNKTVELYTELFSPISLTGSDPNGEVISFEIVDLPQHGTVTFHGDASSNGQVAVYTSEDGYTGPDSFTYKVNDSGDDSLLLATVNINVVPITFYDFNLINDASAELGPFTDYDWVEARGNWAQGNSRSDGLRNFYPLDRVCELHQDVDISPYSAQITAGIQSFRFSGFANSSNDEASVILEFRNNAQEVLLRHDSGKIGDGSTTFYTSDYLAPATATTIRVRLLSARDRGNNNASHDGLSLTAIRPISPFIGWSGDTSFSDDNNSDGVSNGIAYALGADDASVVATDLLPTAELGDDPNYYVFHYRRADNAHLDPNTTICAEYSLNIETWIECKEAEGNSNIMITVIDNGYSEEGEPGVDKVVVKIKRSIANGKGIFCRLKVTQ